MTISPLLGRPGAVGRWTGGSVAAHYGDPLREQRALAEGAGLVDRSDRDVLVVPGADRLSWLHSLTTQHLERLADGAGHRGAGALPARARRAPRGARRAGGTDLARRRAGHRRRAAGFLRADALHAPGRAGAGHRRVGGAVAGRPARPSAACSAAAGLAGARRGSYAVAPLPRAAAAVAADAADRRRDARPWSTCSCRAPSWPAWPTAARRRCRARRGLGATRRCGSRPGGRGSASTPTTAPSRPRWAGCAPPSTWTRAATAARRRSPGCTTWAARRAGWCCCTWTGCTEELPAPGTPVLAGTPRGRASSAPPSATTSSASIALALVKQNVADDAALTVAESAAAIDPDDVPDALDDDRGGGPRPDPRRPICDDRPGDVRHPDHGRAHRRRVGQGRRAGAAGDPGRAGGHRQGVQARRRRASSTCTSATTQARPTLDLARLREVVAALREAPT